MVAGCITAKTSLRWVGKRFAGESRRSMWGEYDIFSKLRDMKTPGTSDVFLSAR